MQNKITITIRRKRRPRYFVSAEEPFPSEAEAAALLRKLATDKASLSKERQHSGAVASGELPLPIDP